MLGAVARDEDNTQKTSYCDRTMDLYVANIDNNDNNTCGNIYEVIDEGYFVRVKLFPRAFINLCKSIQMSHKTFQLIPRIIFKNITRRKFIYAGDEY